MWLIGYDIELSIGDPELNLFKCFIQFSEYAQLTHYHNQLMDIEKLEAFCHGGSDALQLTHNELLYWDEYKNNQWYIGKEYANLKEEITCNTLYCNYILSMQQWDDLY